MMFYVLSSFGQWHRFAIFLLYEFIWMIYVRHDDYQLWIFMDMVFNYVVVLIIIFLIKLFIY
jgi:hypothetical protein